MIAIAVIDDDKAILTELSEKIEAYFQKRQLPVSLQLFQSGGEFLASPLSFDILFLDIQMEGISGMDLSRQYRLAGKNSFIVFITVLKEYIFDCFEVEASDYLLKPIDPNRLKKALDRIVYHLQNADRKKLLITSKKYPCLTLMLKDIYYCEALNHKVEIHLKDKLYDCPQKLEDLQHTMDERFFRCHRSYLVNLDLVCSYRDDMAILENQVQIPVSRLRRKDFSQAILCFMKEKKKYE